VASKLRYFGVLAACLAAGVLSARTITTVRSQESHRGIIVIPLAIALFIDDRKAEEALSARTAALRPAEDPATIAESHAG
jgi:hypothetical protein